MDAMDFSGPGRLLMIFGGVVFVVGVLMVFYDRIPFLGRLPGDLLIQKKGFSLYVPIATCVVLSMLLTVVLNLFGRK